MAARPIRHLGYCVYRVEMALARKAYSDRRCGQLTKIASVILCFNEALNIRYCLDSVRGWSDIYVIDSGSTDGTQSICRE